MKLLLKIALRYLLFTDPNKKHKNISFQSLFAILSVSLGVFALLLTITILNGFENEIITKIQKFSSHIKIQLYENKTLKDKSVILKAIDPIKNEIKSIYYEAESEAILTNNNDAEGVILKGVEPDYLKNILDRYKLEEFKSEQNLKNNLPEIIIGKKLQRKLNLKLGDEINILTLHQNLDIVEYKNHNFKISVIYESGMAEYDDIFCFVDLKIFQNMFLMGESFNTANINLINPENVKNYTNRIEAKLPRYYSVLNYLDLNKNLISWIQLQKGPTPIILGLIMIVGVFNIIGSLLLILLRRISQIGILRAIGLTKKSIERIFIINGLIVGIVGVIIGNILALLISYLQQEFKIISLPSDIYLMNAVPILIDWKNYLLISAITIILIIIASIVPSKIASKYSIIETLKYK